MKNLIKPIKKGVINFFDGNLTELKSIQSLRTMLGHYSLEMSELGSSAINTKYGCRYQYLVAADKDESEMVILVCKSGSAGEEDSIGMYCALDEYVYEYRDDEGKSFFEKEEWRKKIGTKMIISARDFSKGVPCNSFTIVESGVGNDIVEFTRNLSLS